MKYIKTFEDINTDNIKFVVDDRKSKFKLLIRQKIITESGFSIEEPDEYFNEKYVTLYNLKTVEDYQNKGSGHEEPTPKFKIGDEVIVIYDLKRYGRLYFNMVKGNIVTITDFWINANSTISYNIDSPKLRKLRKGYDIIHDEFPEFHFEYEWKIDANKYNL